MQLAYCFGLKHQAVLDICIVSSAYLLRAIAGGAAASIPLSQWFLLVMAFGSLFMVAGKRYAELQLAERTGAKIRKSLESYTSTLPALRLDAVGDRRWCSATALWAFERDGADASWYAVTIIPFTIAILRYAVDVDGGMAGEPEEIALKDRVLQLLAAGLDRNHRCRRHPQLNGVGTTIGAPAGPRAGFPYDMTARLSLWVERARGRWRCSAGAHGSGAGSPTTG